MIIGFCTAPMNGARQLSRTLPENLRALDGSPHFIALCDLAQSPAIKDLVAANAGAVRKGTLLYFRANAPQDLQFASSKNAAHRLALTQAPEVLFNLDPGNYIDARDLERVEQAFEGDAGIVLHNWSTSWEDGTLGRIALPGRTWCELGGYDERLRGIPWHDTDLLVRCRALGLRYQLLMDVARRGIPYTLEEGLTGAPGDLEPSGGSPAEVMGRLHARNFSLSLEQPVKLPLGEQQRYAGLVNESQWVQEL